jgi:protein TonB
MSKTSELHAVSSEGHGQPNFFDTQELRTLSSDSTRQTELLVLSRDQSIIEAVSAAAPSIVKIVSATDVDEVADQPGLSPGVLVVDTAITSDVHAMLPQLLQHYPEIVIIVVGKRDDVSALMRLTASGRIFRFLLVPLAHGQTRLALGAAVAHHLEIKAANVRTGALPVMEGKKSPVGYIALGIGILVAIVGIWFGVAALTSRTEPTQVAEDPTPPASQPSLPAAGPSSEAQTQLQLAKAAFEQGNFTGSTGSSALELYRKALELDPDNVDAQAGLRAIADKILGNAERALTTERLAEAVQGIELARTIDSSNPRIQFLDTQVARERERLQLDQERDRTNRVRQLIQRASADIAAQRFLRPAGANARDALLEARRLDPNDPAVSLAINQLVSTLTEAARRTATAGNVAQAKELLDGARKLGASESAIAAVERSWTEAQKAREIASSKPGSSSSQDKGQMVGAVADPKPSTAESVSSTQSPSSSSSGESAAIPDPSASNASRPDQWLQAIDLPRTREVAPDYPSQAFINGIEGWVDVDFTISPAGVPENPRVRDSSPRRVFDRAAVDSVRQWRFVPIQDNGTPVARRATLRVRFQRQ